MQSYGDEAVSRGYLQNLQFLRADLDFLFWSNSSPILLYLTQSLAQVIQ
jgi:hypothetical protein